MTYPFSFKVLLSVFLTLLASAFAMVTYTNGPLDGHFNKYMMPAERWGMPADLEKRGLEPLYRDETNAGWDGQFYYYVANDLFSKKDTAAHIDADAYRYQRVGVPMLAKLLSLALGQDWVSPSAYYATQLLLVTAGTWIAAVFFARRGVSALWILPWSIGMGTQITLLNGLPDGAADALLIIALICCYRKNYFLYGISVMFASLAREAYILFPLSLLGIHVFVSLRSRKLAAPTISYMYMVLPLLGFGFWQIFLRTHFALTPSQQSAAVLGFPLESMWRHFLGGLSGSYPGLPEGNMSYIAGTGILLFFLVLVSTVLSASSLMRTSFLKTLNCMEKERAIFPLALSIFIFALVALYLCFGDTVMWNMTGYMKAATLLLFVIPFTSALGFRKPGIAIVMLMTIVTLFFDWQGWMLRVNGAPIRYVIDQNCKRAFVLAKDPCLENFIWKGRVLPGLTGKIAGEARIASDMETQSGVLNFGPYFDLPEGRYKITVDYSGRGKKLGYFDVVAAGRNNSELVTLAKIALSEHDGINREVVIDVKNGPLKAVQVRTYYEGGTLSLASIAITRLPE